jgi:hypothetical protein
MKFRWAKGALREKLFLIRIRLAGEIQNNFVKLGKHACPRMHPQITHTLQSPDTCLKSHLSVTGQTRPRGPEQRSNFQGIFNYLPSLRKTPFQKLFLFWQLHICHFYEWSFTHLPLLLMLHTNSSWHAGLGTRKDNVAPAFLKWAVARPLFCQWRVGPTRQGHPLPPTIFLLAASVNKA